MKPCRRDAHELADLYIGIGGLADKAKQSKSNPSDTLIRWERARYYREHANAMWVAARQRGTAVWLREHVRRIRWHIFARKLTRFARAFWRYAYRQIADIRIGARRTMARDEPAAPVMSETKAWDDYNEEYEDDPDAYNEDDNDA